MPALSAGKLFKELRKFELTANQVIVEFVNKVAQSGIVSFDLEDYFPDEKNIIAFDLKDYLFKGLILREKDFREALAAINWSDYTDKHLAIFCSADAIIPNWAWMLIVAQAEPFAKTVTMGTVNEVIVQLYRNSLAHIDTTQFVDQRVVIKGCSDKPVPAEAYLEITKILRPLAKSIMYGEPCSTVPVYKKK
ncbi:MAG: DUF2480 family protein [Bacteroidetes bacterium]|nr:DUF2480 family protein [Bacteroidota bacterium]